MKILLISPQFGIKRKILSKFINYNSLAIEIVAALTPDNHEVVMINENNRNIDFEDEYDLVGISCLTCNAIRGYRIADKFREKGITVVLGGYHPSALPIEAKEHADSVVIGEAEGSWPQLLNDFENKKIKPFYKSNEGVDPKLIPFAKRVEKNISTITQIQATRGCPVGCEFCAISKIEGQNFRARPIKNVIDEIKSINNKNLFFVDASLTIDPNYTKALFKEMKELNIKFDCFGNINILAKDEELLRLASEAGCNKWFIGFESFSQKTINSMNKKTNKIEEYNVAIDKIKNHGMMITGLFMYGFDSDTPQVFDNTLQVLYDLRIDTASFSVVTPYPGTSLFNKLDKENRILTKDWSQYNEGSVVYKPKNMSREELLNGIKKASMEYYSFSSSFKRCLKNKNSSIAHFGNNIIENFFISRRFYKDLFNY